MIEQRIKWGLVKWGLPPFYITFCFSCDSQILILYFYLILLAECPYILDD